MTGKRFAGNTNTTMGNVQDLFAYQKGFQLSMAIFHRTKMFPTEEQHSMTDQIRRSSRLVVTNLAEAYRRRRSQKYFAAKLNDCETELCETPVWLGFALACAYMQQHEYDEPCTLAEEVGSLLNFMANNPKKFL